MNACPFCKFAVRIRTLWFRFRRRVFGPCPLEYEVAALSAIHFIDGVFLAIHATDDLEPLPWRKSTLEDRQDLLDLRTAAVCLLRDLSIGRPASQDLIAVLLADEDISDLLRTRGLLL